MLVLFFEEIFMMFLQNPTWLPQRANSRLDELCSVSCGIYHVRIKAQMPRAFSFTFTFNLIKNIRALLGSPVQLLWTFYISFPGDFSFDDRVFLDRYTW